MMFCKIMKTVTVIAVALAGVILFLLNVWPTVWEYEAESGLMQAPADWDRRVSRVSGQQQVFVDGGWRDVIYERSEPAP